MSLPGTRAARAALAAALLSAPAFATAHDEQQLRVQVEQKIRLSARLIGDSSTTQRIAGSGHGQAVGHLDEGRVHQALAEERLARGDVAGARQAVDEALRHIGLARRLVPDAPAQKAAAKARHDQLLASVERLIEAWRARTGGDGRELAGAMALVADARQQAQEQRYEESAKTLAQAERQVLEGMNRVLASTTLDYTLRPAGPLEEFQQELSRQRGFAELVPLAVQDLRPGADAMALIERYTDTSRTLHAQALQHFEGGDVAKALTHIRNATLYLQRALLAAGLVAPTPTGNPP